MRPREEGVGRVWDYRPGYDNPCRLIATIIEGS